MPTEGIILAIISGGTVGAVVTGAGVGVGVGAAGVWAVGVPLPKSGLNKVYAFIQRKPIRPWEVA